MIVRKRAHLHSFFSGYLPTWLEVQRDIYGLFYPHCIGLQRGFKVFVLFSTLAVFLYHRKCCVAVTPIHHYTLLTSASKSLWHVLTMPVHSVIWCAIIARTVPAYPLYSHLHMYANDYNCYPKPPNTAPTTTTTTTTHQASRMWCWSQDRSTTKRSIRDSDCWMVCSWCSNRDTTKLNAHTQ